MSNLRAQNLFHLVEFRNLLIEARFSEQRHTDGIHTENQAKRGKNKKRNKTTVQNIGNMKPKHG